MHHVTHRLCAVFLGVWAVSGVLPSLIAGEDSILPARDREAPLKRPVDSDERPRVQGVRLEKSGFVESLVLEQFQVFSPDIKIVLHSQHGDRIMVPPANTYYKGHIDGRRGSRVSLVVLETGDIRGVINDRGRHWVLGGNSLSKSGEWLIESREVEPAIELDHDSAGFVCETDLLQSPPSAPPKTEQANGSEGAAAIAVSYTARIAVETDNEFFNKFGNATDATNYVADIIAYGSVLYGAEVSTTWLLQHLSLWPQGETDPWSQSSSICGLFEFGRYWNDHRQNVSRTTAAFFSGKNTNSGVAWLGVLCRGPFNYDLKTSCSGLTPSIDNYGGAYAYVGSMSGNFDIDNPAVLWDIVAVTHEIGHNFSSPHTHCYANLGGNSSPIDQCYAGECGTTGCHCGSSALPSGCPGSGSGCGTIMSYCHLLYPGMSNLSLTLGLSHPYGIEPDRVPERMFSHVSSQATFYPGCLDCEVADRIFSDGFEGSSTYAWSSTVP